MQALSQTEISHVWLVERIDQHVGGFEVAVENAVFVRVVNGLGDNLDITRRAPQPRRIPISALFIQLRETPTFDEIHGEERLSFVSAYLMDGDDVRVLQTSSRGCFRAEALC